MIQATELRIGNITGAGKVVEILEDKFYVNDGESSLSSGWYDIKPEPLTEEWLKRFGFTCGSARKDWFSKYIQGSVYFYYHLDTNESGIIQHDEDFDYENEIENLTTNHIKHVHQLQNLYHALTGEELTIK